MIRKATAAIAATAIATAVLTAAPAAAAPPTIMSGSSIRDGNFRTCSLSFADPVYHGVAYTAAHCYNGYTAVMSRSGYRIGKYRPDWVYNKTLDLVAIQLYSDIPIVVTQCRQDACYPFGEPRDPKVGDHVCKWGSTTQETCGTVLNVWDHDFAIQMPVKPGDSGAPIYQIDTDGWAHLLGVVDSKATNDASIAYGTIITRITDLLANTWGPTWRMG